MDAHRVSCDDRVVGKPRTLHTKTLIIIAAHPLWHADAAGKLLLSLAGLGALLPNLTVPLRALGPQIHVNSVREICSSKSMTTTNIFFIFFFFYQYKQSYVNNAPRQTILC